MFKTMNSSYLREIPLRILNRKIGDEHVTLLQACYDNPIFHEEDGKRRPQQNGGTAEKTPPGNPDYHGVEVCNNSHDGRTRGYSGGHAASEYMHSLPPTSPTPNDITFRGHRKRKRRCALCTICIIVALVVAIGILIYLLEDGDQSSNTQIQSPAISVSKVEVNLTLRDGPFSQYMLDYTLPNTDASRLLRRAFVYEISDVFTSSDLSYIYNKTDIVRINNANGSVSLNFIIQPPPRVTCSASCEARVAAILLQGLKDSLFIVDSGSVSAKVYAVPKPKPHPCLPVLFKGCVNHTGYFSWSTPNILGHQSEQEVTSYLNKHKYFLDKRCYNFATEFYCGAFFPGCSHGGRKPLLPCRRFCQDVMAACQKDYEKYNITVPFHCNDLVDSDDPRNCTQSPYLPGKCVPNVRKDCLLAGFNTTVFPNAIGSMSSNEKATPELFHYIITLQVATNCFKYSSLFACSILTPPCSGKEPPNHFIPPCRSFCQKYENRCKIFLDVFQAHWPDSINCSSFPDSPDPTVCTGYYEAREPDERSCYKGQVQCAEDSNMCIDVNWLCDGEQDCPSNSDEQHCATCGPNEDRCSPTTAVCISKSQGCDGTDDCYGETDETYCVRTEPGVGNYHLQVRNPELNNVWEDVCEEGWTKDFSNMTCRQLGYQESLATYFTVQNNNSTKSMISSLKNGSDPNRLQSYLQKGVRSCPTGRVVQLLCWKAACGFRPAHVVSPVRILGGQEVVPGTWPWMVSLHGGSGESFFCGASIIGDEWILTASHCIGGADKETSYWTIKTGNTRRDVYSEYRQVRKPKKLFRHQGFSFDTVENDVALIQLDRPFKFNDHVRAVCLPETGTDPGTRCHVTGWGRSNPAGPEYKLSLRQVTVDVTSWGHCYNAFQRSVMKPPYELKKSMFCAGGTREHDACQGDSGGPLVCRKDNTTDEWYQSGLVSWGITCGLPRVPGVYTNLTHYLDWMSEIMANNTKNTGRDVIKTTG